MTHQPAGMMKSPDGLLARTARQWIARMGNKQTSDEIMPSLYKDDCDLKNFIDADSKFENKPIIESHDSSEGVL